MEYVLLRFVVYCCLPIHNFVPHTFLHDDPCHKTMKKHGDFEGMAVFLLPPLKFAIQT